MERFSSFDRGGREFEGLTAREQLQLVVGHEHESKRISIVRDHYLATTSKDRTQKAQCVL
jgi:hypothetical protein